MLKHVKRFLGDVIIFAGVALFATSGTLAGQSRDALKQKYGAPVSETFIVRPGITATATFGSNGRISEFLISPQQNALIKSRIDSMSIDSVNEIIDELVPRSLRGKHLIAGFVNATCLPENDCNGTSDSYEKAAMYYNSAGQGRVHYAVVQLRE
jgi:hypothetical protein